MTGITNCRFVAANRVGTLNLERDRRSGGQERGCFCKRRGTDRGDGAIRKWFAASAGGSMIQTAIENKYGLDIEVSSADMADQAVKRS